MWLSLLKELIYAVSLLSISFHQVQYKKLGLQPSWKRQSFTALTAISTPKKAGTAPVFLSSPSQAQVA